MYRILIVDESTQVLKDKVKSEQHIEYVIKEKLKEELEQQEYDVLYLKDDLQTEEIKKIILYDFMMLPSAFEKVILNIENYKTFINIQILNKLIIENIDIIEFEDYYERLLIANIIKEQIMQKTSLEKVYKKICPNEINKNKNVVKKIITRHYAGKNILRKCKFILHQKRIQKQFFNKILQNIDKDISNMEKLEGDMKMNEKIKIIIADDNVAFCNNLKVYLEQYEEVDILGLAHNDEDEIKMIEDLNPEVVITDLLRNHKYTGLEIIKDYNNKANSPKFLIISADKKEDVIDDSLKIGGYIKKPFFNYENIIQELRRIKTEIIEEQKQLIISQNNQLIKIGFLQKIIQFLK